MAWQTVQGLDGKVFIPECRNEGKKKNPCPDCFACQNCSDERCRVCAARGAFPTETPHCHCSSIEEIKQ